MPENELHVVLVEPEIPQNTGNIARTCAAIGAGLHLIEPLGFEISDRTLKRAGLDYWQYLNWKTYPDLETFFQEEKGAYYFFSTKAKKRHIDARFAGKTYLFFGKETRGLPESLLRENYDCTLRLPMKDKIRSLNLSNAVAIACYEALRQWDFEGFVSQGNLTEEE